MTAPNRPRALAATTTRHDLASARTAPRVPGGHAARRHGRGAHAHAGDQRRANAATAGKTRSRSREEHAPEHHR
jgi:hypothetical protein